MPPPSEDKLNYPLRPIKEAHPWMATNHWIRRRYERMQQVIFDSYCALEMCGLWVPKYWDDTACSDFYDTDVDLTGYPEFDVCFKTGIEMTKGYKFEKHGPWTCYMEAHMLEKIDRAICERYLVDNLAFIEKMFWGNLPDWFRVMRARLVAPTP